MLVSGGKIIAIDGVNTTSATLSGDGVFTPLGVNTNTIATTSFVQTEDNKIKNTLSSVSSTLNEKITTVSSDLSAAIDKKQEQLEFKGEYDRITAIGPLGGQISAVGGNTVDVSGGTHVQVVTDTTAQPGITTFIVSVTGEQTDANVLGENGLSSRQVENTFYVGLSSTYENAIKKVSSISADITALSSNKADKNSVYQKTETSSNNELTTEFAKYQPKGDYYSATNPSGFINKSSADNLYQPKGNYLSSNALNNLSGNWENTFTAVTNNSGNWNSVYTTVSTNSGNWNEISSVSGIRNELKTFSAVVINKKDDPTLDYVVPATTSASIFKLVEKPNNYVTLDTNNNNQILIGVTGLQPAGDYVTNTEFVEYKNSAKSALDLKQDKSAMSAYAESAWVVDNFLSANALDNLSGKWEAASDEVTSHSANWNNVYNTVTATSSNWNDVSAKLNKDNFEEWSATIDTAFYSAGEGLALDNHTFSISAKYLSANALDDLSGKWEDAADNLSSNSAKWNSVYNTVETYSADWQNVVNSAEKWNTVYDEYTDNSAVWNDTTNIVDSYSAIWNEVSSKANSADLVELSGKVRTLSSELETASAFIEDQIEVLSGSIDNISAVFSADIDYLSGAIDDKLDTNDFTAWSANADITPYTAGEGLALDDHQFYVSAKYVTSAGDSLSGKMLVLKDNKWEEIPDFGGFTTADGTDADYHPDVSEPSNKLIYLVKEKNLPPSSDNYKEWIYTLTETPQWECIGETTLDLTPYQLKLSAGDYISISGETNVISVTGLHNTIVTANNDTILITPTTALNGDVTYDLEVTYPSISGINGISAGYIDDQYVVSLEDHLYSYAEAQTSLTTLTTNPETITGFNNKKIIGDNISFVNDVINLEPGLYHIDMQVYIPVAGGDNNYYNVQLVPSISYSTLDQVVDGSFAHNDTLDLSFDVQIDSADTLTFVLNGLPAGYKYLVKNLQIHEVTTIDSVMQATGGTYRGGVATNIDNENKINVEYATASGLAVDPVNNMLYVKLGEGLKFDTSGAAAGSLSLNNITQEVVETVQELKAELDGKLTTNFPYPMINNNNTDFATYKGNGDNCICQLFSVSLTHKITTDTYFTVYMKDSGYTQTNVIFGIFEYNFDYWDATAGRWRGQTNWVCDTGPVTLAKPTADTKLEFQVKHINPLHNELRSDRAYYAVLALKSDSGNGVFLACCDNYDGDVHSEPTLNWRWESVPNLDFVNPSGTLENTQWWDSGVNNYYEKADMRRFFLQIRNKVQPATNP